MRIATRCPSCGSQTLFIGSGGHLTCGLLPCKNPSVGDALKRFAQIEKALAGFVDNANGYDKSWAHVAALALRRTDIYDREYIASTLDAMERHGQRLLKSPHSTADPGDGQ
jgi:hypothetical protein